MSLATRILPLCSIGLGLGLGLAWFGTHRPNASAPESTAIALPAAPSTSASLISPARSPGESAEPAGQTAPAPSAPSSIDEPEPSAVPLLSDEARSRLVAEIESAYTTYDPAALPKIAPRLRHADPEIRAFARDAIVQLGHADGVPLLRAAAREARDPREAAALLEAAEFLELPPAPPVTSPAFPPVARQASAKPPASPL